MAQSVREQPIGFFPIRPTLLLRATTCWRHAMSESSLKAGVQWERQVQAQEAYLATTARLLEASPQTKAFVDKLLQETAIRLMDIVDHLVLADDALLATLNAAGWSQDGTVLRNPSRLRVLVDGRTRKLDATMRCRLKTSPEFSLELLPKFREYPQEKMIERARYIFAELVRRQRD